jgi:D-sedoheptulose 7-phosphate isomerase
MAIVGNLSQFGDLSQFRASVVDDISTYLEEISGLANALDQEAFASILAELVRAQQARRTIFLLGNGISSATADHLANDVSKSGGGRLSATLGFGMRVVSLTGGMPFLTALANDISLNAMFREALRAHAAPGDLLLIFTARAPHENLVEAAHFGRQRGLRVAAVTGADPGDLAYLAHALYTVPAESVDLVEDMHMFLCHCWTASLRQEVAQPVVFLDRDGVVNANRSDYVKSWDEFLLFPDVAAAIRRLNEAGYAVVVVTNQSAIGRGIISEATVEQMHAQMCHLLAGQGAWISKVYYCPHHPNADCLCRKPRGGLIQQALAELPVDATRAFMVGDHASDVAAGRSCGLTTVLVTSGRGTVAECGLDMPDHVAPDLTAAVDWILRCEPVREVVYAAAGQAVAD